MKWFKRTIVGSQHHEYRSDDQRTYLFNVSKSPSGIIRLHDLRDNPATYYLFSTVREAKKVAIQSITDKSVLMPYLDHKWYELSASTVEVMKRAQELIDSLKKP